jgi:hypothetical protein
MRKWRGYGDLRLRVIHTWIPDFLFGIISVHDFLITSAASPRKFQSELDGKMVMLNKDAQIALLREALKYSLMVQDFAQLEINLRELTVRALQDTNSTFVEGPDYDN